MRKPSYLFVLHTSHAALFTVTFGTALLLLFPELRARFVGGYSATIKGIHLWFGIAALVVPVVVYAGARRWPKMPPWRFTGWWRGIHVRYTYWVTLIFGASGLVMWKPDYFSVGLSERMFSIHEWLTYAAGAVLGLHVLVVGTERALAALRWILAREGARARGKTGALDRAWAAPSGLRREIGGERWR